VATAHLGKPSFVSFGDRLAGTSATIHAESGQGVNLQVKRPLRARHPVSKGPPKKASHTGPPCDTATVVAGIRVGYARCSTNEQDLTAQIEQLVFLGVERERIYVDRGMTGTRRERPRTPDPPPPCKQEVGGSNPPSPTDKLSGGRFLWAISRSQSSIRSPRGGLASAFREVTASAKDVDRARHHDSNRHKRGQGLEHHEQLRPGAKRHGIRGAEGGGVGEGRI